MRQWLSGDRDIRAREIVAFAEQQHIELPRAGIGEAIAEIEARRVTPFAEALKCTEPGATDLRVDRNQFGSTILNQTLDQPFRIGEGKSSTTRQSENRLIEADRRYIDSRSAAETRDQCGSVAFAAKNGHDRRRINKHQPSPHKSS